MGSIDPLLVCNCANYTCTISEKLYQLSSVSKGGHGLILQQINEDSHKNFNGSYSIYMMKMKQRKELTNITDI